MIDDLFVEIGGHPWYSVLDLKGAYQQLRVSESSRELLVINTHLGLFRYTRMPFGIKPAASIFQKFMDGLLQGLDFAVCYIDDVIIFADSKEMMTHRLCVLFELLRKSKVKVNFAKCEFYVKEVKYLGHVVSAEGLKP